MQPTSWETSTCPIIADSCAACHPLSSANSSMIAMPPPEVGTQCASCYAWLVFFSFLHMYFIITRSRISMHHHHELHLPGIPLRNRLTSSCHVVHTMPCQS